ncbi:MAG TPA: hypothetical protein VNY05_22160 [Candidatus Acidoferrales bacterium]|nr:hypothetical protein [Candidatus Acidoferrales bacterium]
MGRLRAGRKQQGAAEARFDGSGLELLGRITPAIPAGAAGDSIGMAARRRGPAAEQFQVDGE